MKSRDHKDATDLVVCRDIASALTGNYGKQPDNSDTALGPNIVGQVNMQGSKGNAVTDEGKTAFTLNAMHGHDVHAVAIHQNQEGDVHVSDCGFTVGTTANASARNTGLCAVSVDQYKGALSDAQPTLGSNCGVSTGRNGVMAQMSVRRLTPLECERLQGFPDGWTQGFADSTRYKMLGNAVCVNVSEWLALRIKI